MNEQERFSNYTKACEQAGYQASLQGFRCSERERFIKYVEWCLSLHIRPARLSMWRSVLNMIPD